ncbi:MAG: two-component regulator propeller domain-containing protein [Flavobacterium sp.]|nr:two-component regulator propeller domain-containing protein [Flavobacterium sp.]
MTSKNRNFIVRMCYLFLLSIPHFVASQNNIYWTTDSDFLPQNSIKSIVPDKYGFIWMSTENGLVRYDGKDFEVYNNQNINVKNNRFLYITGNTRKDSLFINNDSEDDYILIHERQPQKIDPKKHPESKQYIRASNTPFVSNGIPSIFFEREKIPYKIPLPSGKYFIIANDHIYFYNEKKKLTTTQKFEYESNSRFFALDNVLFYVKGNGEYAKISSTDISWDKLDVTLDSDSKLYWNIITQQVFLYHHNNLFTISYKDDKLEKSLLIANENFINHSLGSIYYDVKNGIVYLGSLTKGLGIYKILSFRSLKTKLQPSGKYEVYYAMHQLSGDTILTSEGVIFNNNRAIASLNFASDKYAVVMDKNGDAWIKNGEYLCRYKKSEGYRKCEKWPMGAILSTLYQGTDGKIWFSKETLKYVSKGLFYFYPEEKPIFRKFSDNNLMVTCLQQSENDNLWLGTRTGIYRLDIKSQKYYHLKSSEDLKVRSVFITDRNNVWVTTYEKGFYLFRNGKKYTFPTDKNKYLLSTHCIIEDRNGFFWISTNKGLFQVLKKSLLDYADKKTNAVYYQYYNKDSGFITNELNGGCQPCGVFTKEQIFFPSMNGVVTFNPEKIRPILPTNAIFIDKVQIDNQDFLINDTLKLNRDFGRITFFITSPYYGNRNNQDLETKLEGVEDLDWTDIRIDNKVSFTNLYPGSYQLIVRKLSGFNTGYIYKKITILVEPAFWQTIWFRIFIAILIACSIVSFYKIRTRIIIRRNSQLEKNINERTRHLKNTITTLRTTKVNLNQQIENNTKIIQIITHDLKSPLKFMTMTSKYMYESFDKDTEDLKDNINAIYSSSSQMYNFVENLLEYSKVNLKDDELQLNPFFLSDIIDEKIDLFEGIAGSRKTTIQNLIPKETTLKKNKQLFRIIIHNLLDNAVKHTTNGLIAFKTATIKNKTTIIISDNGKGMNANLLSYYQSMAVNYEIKKIQNKERVGLHIVLELLIILNGTMNIESQEGHGTTVTLIFD